MATRTVALGAQEANLEKRADGTMIVRSPFALDPTCARITDYLVAWAAHTPDQTFIARHGADGEWIKVTYAEMLARVRGVAAGLLKRDLSLDRPIAILSGNSIEHLTLAFAAMYAGIPYAPVSTAYSLISRDFDKLRHVLDLLTPGMIFADAKAYAGAIRATAPHGCEIVTLSADDMPGATTLSALETDDFISAIKANDRVTPDTIAKFLFTSGSTGMPKGVINTQRMICSNIVQIGMAIPELADTPQVLVEWLPWNHTFGGNHNVHIALRSGGSLYIDDGRPALNGFDATLRNLKEIAPTCYFSVPKGFEMLVPRLDADPVLAQNFFSRLKFIMYAGASLPQHVWDGFDRVALKTIGETIRVVTGLGATETSPSATFVTQGELRAGMIGVPVPACDLKLLPNGDKLEARFRGPNITPGYWRLPDATRAAFDEEGFYKIGDAVRFVDEADVSKGFWFDGRVSEDFKLTTGTWVSVGALRAKLVAHFAPLIRDAVIAGHDRETLTAILLLDHDGYEQVTGVPAREPPAIHAAHPDLRAKLAAHLVGFAQSATGSSTRIERIVVLDEHPSLDRGEVTDKGSINQRAVLAARAHLVEELYGERPTERVIAVAQP